MQVDPEIGMILSNVTQIIISIGVILTAISSITNRRKLEKMDTRLIEAAVASAVAAERARVAAFNTDIIVARADEVKAQIAEVREAAVAVNAEVIDRITNGGKT